MTTEEMIEEWIQKGMKGFKRMYRNLPEARKLDRHETIKLTDETEVSCWREFTVYKMALYINDKFPKIDLEVNFDGNNSSLSLSVTDEEQQRLNTILYALLGEVK